MLVLDTNVYLDAGRDDALRERVAALVRARPDPLGLSSVVVAELLIGTSSPDERRLVLAATVDVVPADHVLTPDRADWQTAADALNALGGESATKGRSFWNDLLIAASCARAGATLITRNAEDFRRIGRVISVAVVPRPT